MVNTFNTAESGYKRTQHMSTSQLDTVVDGGLVKCHA